VSQLHRDSGRNIGAVVLIALGVVFLFGQLLEVNLWSTFSRLFALDWPFLVILPGAILLAIGVFGPRQVLPLTVPGAVVAGTGLILLLQSRTGRYETWAYLWGLYPMFVGVAVMYMGFRTGSAAQVSSGRKAVAVGLALTVIFGVFMESIFSGSFDTIVRFIVPVALMGAGALLLIRNRRASATLRSGEKAKHEAVGDKAKNGI
jgi:hypothetical protein